MQGKILLSSKLIVAGLVILLAFLSNIKYQQYRAGQAIEKEKTRIIEQEEKLEKKNRELTQSLEMLTSKTYKERVMREQLNMKKEGELVYNFPDAQPTALTAAPLANVNNTTAQANASNAQKWWDYFFNN